MSSYLDLDSLNALFDDPKELQETLAELSKMLRSDLPLCIAFAQQHNWPELAAKIHRWNGSLGHFIKPVFAQQVRDLELLARQGAAPAAILASLESTQTLLLDVCKEIDLFNSST